MKVGSGQGDSQGTETGRETRRVGEKTQRRNSPKEAVMLWAGGQRNRSLEWRERRQEARRRKGWAKPPGRSPAKKRGGGMGGGRLGEEQEGGRWVRGAGDRKCCAGWITVSLSSGMVWAVGTASPAHDLWSLSGRERALSAVAWRTNALLSSPPGQPFSLSLLRTPVPHFTPGNINNLL